MFLLMITVMFAYKRFSENIFSCLFLFLSNRMLVHLLPRHRSAGVWNIRLQTAQYYVIIFINIHAYSI